MSIDVSTAWWFAPLVIPICLYVCWTDMSRMKITNVAVIALAAVFLVLGLFALPLSAYPWLLIGDVATSRVIDDWLAANAPGASIAMRASTFAVCYRSVREGIGEAGAVGVERLGAAVDAQA